MSSFNDLIHASTPVLVDFTVTWCGPCKMMAPILIKVAERMEGKVKIIKVDVDKNKHASNFYQIQGVPTLILFREGKQLWRQSGVIQENQLLEILNQYL